MHLLIKHPVPIVNMSSCPSVGHNNHNSEPQKRNIGNKESQIGVGVCADGFYFKITHFGKTQKITVLRQMFDISLLWVVLEIVPCNFRFSLG